MSESESPSSSGAVSEEPAPQLGLLFVHGIGSQRQGETLSAFAEPLYTWLVDRFRGLDLQWQAACAGADPAGRLGLRGWRREVEAWASDGFDPDAFPSLGETANEGADEATDTARLIGEIADRLGGDLLVGRVEIEHAVLADPGAPEEPAHAVLRLRRARLDGHVEEERWLLAESWWAETFAPPGFADLARWALGTVPWTVGSHFGAQLRRILARRAEAVADPSPWRRARRWGGIGLRVLGAALGLTLGVLLSPLLLAALFVVLLVALVPIPTLRQALLQLQLQLASTLGDSYILVSRPLEAASIVSRVRADLDWLARRVAATVVVAHSQGGAVMHKALRREPPAGLRLLFTFGSGLKKLEQLEHLVSRGASYRRSAAFTLVALPLFALTLLWFLVGVASGYFAQPDADLFSSTLSVLLFFVLSLLFLVAGFRDYVRGLDLPALDRWIGRLTASRLDWVDCFATADPVSNGPLLDWQDVADRSVEVCNLASLLRDHTSYWVNRDQFVTLLVSRLARPELRASAGLPPAPALSTDPVRLEWLGARRRWRIGMRTAIVWTAIVSVGIAVYEAPEAWAAFLTHGFDRFVAWIVDLVGGESAPVAPHRVAWPAVGMLALAWAPYALSKRLWARWNEAEMRALVQGRTVATNIPVALALTGQILVAAGLLYGDAPPFGIFFIVLLAIPVVMAWTEPKRPQTAAAADERIDEAVSGAEVLRVRLQRLVQGLLPPFIFGLLGWQAIGWVVGRFFGGAVFGFRPAAVSAALVGAAAALLYVGWTYVRGRGRAVSP